MGKLCSHTDGSFPEMTNCIFARGDVSRDSTSSPIYGPLVVRANNGNLYAFRTPVLDWVWVRRGYDYVEELAAGVWCHCHQAKQGGPDSWYAFRTKEHLRLFTAMLQGQGIGPGTALKIMAANTSEKVLALVKAGDVEGFKKLNGCGPKTGAAITEVLFDKETSDYVTPPAAKPTAPAVPQNVTDAIKALESLGHKLAEAKLRVGKAVAKLGEGASVQDYIVASL